MENIEALTYGAMLLAFLTGILVALAFTYVPVTATSIAAFWVSGLYFAPLTSALFIGTLVDGLAMNPTVLHFGSAMLLAYGVATAATLTVNLVRGRVNGGLPPLAF